MLRSHALIDKGPLPLCTLDVTIAGHVRSHIHTDAYNAVFVAYSNNNNNTDILQQTVPGPPML